MSTIESSREAAKPRREDLDKLTLADLLLEHVQSDTREQRAKRRGFKEFLERQLGYPLDVDDLFSLRGFAASQGEVSAPLPQSITLGKSE